VDLRSKQFAELRAQCKCQTCAHPHHEQKKIKNLPVRCNKGMSVGRGIEHCPCDTCTCQLCVLDGMQKLKHRHTLCVKTLEDIESDAAALARKYPGDEMLKGIVTAAHNTLMLEGKHDCGK
jgi:hypothetical protein